jgi:hypothetical protein
MMAGWKEDQYQLQLPGDSRRVPEQAGMLKKSKAVGWFHSVYG